MRLPDAKYVSTAQGALESANDEARRVKFYVPKGGRAFLHPSSALFSAATWPSPWLVYTSKHEQQQQPPAGGSDGARFGPRTVLREVTMVTPTSLLLFGGDVQIEHGESGATAVLVDAEARLLLLWRDAPDVAAPSAWAAVVACVRVARLMPRSWMPSPRHCSQAGLRERFGAAGHVAVLLRELRSELDALLLRKLEDPSADIRSSRVIDAIVEVITNEALAHTHP